jgi:hypothetical protein
VLARLRTSIFNCASAVKNKWADKGKRINGRGEKKKYSGRKDTSINTE